MRPCYMIVDESEWQKIQKLKYSMLIQTFPQWGANLSFAEVLKLLRKTLKKFKQLDKNYGSKWKILIFWHSKASTFLKTRSHWMSIFSDSTSNLQGVAAFLFFSNLNLRAKSSFWLVIFQISFNYKWFFRMDPFRVLKKTYLMFFDLAKDSFKTANCHSKVFLSQPEAC